MQTERKWKITETVMAVAFGWGDLRNTENGWGCGREINGRSCDRCYTFVTTVTQVNCVSYGSVGVPPSYCVLPSR
jgi:hypothetical protein